MKKMNYVIFGLLIGFSTYGDGLKAVLSQSSADMIQSIRTDLNQALGKLNMLEKQLDGEVATVSYVANPAISSDPVASGVVKRRRKTTPMVQDIAVSTKTAGKTRRGGFRSAGVSWGGDIQSQE